MTTTPKPTVHYGPGWVKTITITCADGSERVCREQDFRTALEACPGFRGFRVEKVWSNLTRLGAEER